MAVPASFDAVSPLPVPGVQAAHYVGDLFPGIAAVVGRLGSGRRSAVLAVLLHPGGHLPDPAGVFRIVYLVDLLFGIVDHVVELQRGLSVDPVLFAGTVFRVEYQLVLRRPVGEIAGSRRGDQVGPGGVARAVEYRPEAETVFGLVVGHPVAGHLVRQMGLHAVGAPVAVADAALDFIQSAAGFFESRVRLFLRHVVDHVEVRRSGRRGQPVEIVESPIGGTVGHAFREADVVDGFRLAFLVCPIPPQMPFADGRGFFPKAP